MNDAKYLFPSDAIYLSLIDSEFFRGRGRTIPCRKTALTAGTAVVSQDQSFNSVIKGRAKQIDYFANNDAKPGGDTASIPSLYKCLDDIRVVINDFTVRVFALKKRDLGFELRDVFIGPL